MKSLSKLKKELDKHFSLFIRLRGADDLGLVECFTCQKIAHYKNAMQNGHFMSRKFNSTRFDEENCQIQCSGCNIFKFGEQYKFSKNLDLKYGIGKAQELESKSRLTQKFSRADYLEKISYYKKLVENLKSEKQIE
tara:strand:- start:8043 stop:8450 length:408 start_codon:yes stop_codon:yes gene_type:complete